MGNIQHHAQIEGAPPRRAPYSIAAAVANRPLAFLSGQGPFTTDDELVTGSFRDQAQQTFRNISAVVHGLGAQLSDVIRVGVYMQDMAQHFKELNVIYQEFFRDPLPARTVIPTPGLRFALEIDAVVALPMSTIASEAK